MRGCDVEAASEGTLSAGTAKCVARANCTFSCIFVGIQLCVCVCVLLQRFGRFWLTFALFRCHTRVSAKAGSPAGDWYCRIRSWSELRWRTSTWSALTGQPIQDDIHGRLGNLLLPARTKLHTCLKRRCYNCLLLVSTKHHRKWMGIGLSQNTLWQRWVCKLLIIFSNIILLYYMYLIFYFEKSVHVLYNLNIFSCSSSCVFFFSRAARAPLPLIVCQNA